MKSILIICFNDLKNDARVTRQINFLKSAFKVTVLCYDAHADDAVNFVFLGKNHLTLQKKMLLSFLLLGRFYNAAYKILHPFQKHTSALRDKNFDLIVANDYETLPLAFAIAAKKSKVFLDAHEYAPRQFEDRLYWRVFFQKFVLSICEKYIPLVDGMSTINQGIATAYREKFGKESIIITNASPFVDNKPVPRLSYPIRLVHHGIYTLSRQPHLMVDMMDVLGDKFTLDLIYLIPPNASAQTRASYEALKNCVDGRKNIRILPPLKASEIIPVVHANYDIGIILIPPINFNYQNGLPNKLFDCIQARIAMCVGPLREIANIVEGYNIGLVSRDFTPMGMADTLKGLTLDQLNEFKHNTNKAASKMNAGFNQQIMLNEINRILA
jgi:hypothetical protein